MGIPTVKIASKSSPTNFKSALNKLASDAAFREDVTKNPTKLTDTFKLSLVELHALRQAAVLSGTDMTQINRVRAAELTRVGSQAADVGDINVSCCCCCCCGETSVVQAYA